MHIPVSRFLKASEDDCVAYAVVDCLTQWLEGFRKLTDQSINEKLKSLIQEFLTHENSKCRLIALKYMEAFLSSDEIDLRWMLLQACGDNRDEIRGEATRLLDVSLKVDVPIEKVASYLWDHLKVDIVDSETGKEKSQSSQVISPLIHQMSSRYLWAIMARAAGLHTDLKIIDSGHEWKEIAPKIAQQIKILPSSCQECITRISLQALKEAQEVPLFHIATCFSAACPPSDPPVSLLTSCIQRIRGTTRSDMANVGAHLAASLLGVKERETINVTAGDCWFISAFIASHATPRSTVPTVINHLINISEEGYNKPNNVLESALGSMANILRTILSHDKEFELPADVLERLLSVCEKIAVSRKDAVSTKAHEEATNAIGFCATTMSSSIYDKLSAVLYSIGNGPPQPEVQLIVGSALFDVALGPYSTSRRNLYLTLEEDFELSSLTSEIQDNCEKRLAQIFSKIFDEKLSSLNHHERRSALIWLLVIVRRSFKARASLLAGMLDKIQTDFTQDVASSGIGLVYEMASGDQRKALVNDLISRISDGKPFSTTKVDSNTEIFTKRTQITGPDCTYKELCSLATDLNQPDLVYKFMNLARHNSVWNLKKGAALGFAAVLEEASNEFEPFIGQLVPKLFRYRYDPDLKVRQSMRSIWTVLTASRRGLNLSLVYLRFASGNLSNEERLRLLPSFFEVLSSKVNETSQCAELLSLCVPAFMILTQKEKHTWPKLVLSEEVKLLLLRFLHCIVAFPVDPPDVIKSTCTALTNGEKVFTPAITADEYLMVAGKVFTKDVTLVPIKLCALKLLVSGLFDELAIFSILVLASAQNIDSVTSAAEAALKKIDIQLCVDNQVVVDELMAAYLGTTTVTKPVMGKGTVISPANFLMKQKILQYLTRSSIAPVTYMNNMKICLDGLTQASYTKLLVAALNFLYKVIEKMPAAAQKNLSALLFDRVQKIREEVKNGNALSLIYRCMGILGKRDPSIITRQIDTIPLTFREIAHAPDDVAYAVVDCLTQWLEGFRKLTDQSINEKLKSLIQEFLTHENSKCRLIALKYMEAFLSSDEIDLRWMLLQACGDNRDEIRGEATRLLDVSLKVDVPIEKVASYLWDHLKVDIVDSETGKEKSQSSQVISPLIHQMVCVLSYFHSKTSAILVPLQSSRYLWAIMARAAGLHTDLKIIDSGHEWKEIAPKIAQQIKILPSSCQECITRISLQALKEAQEVPLFHIATCFSAACPPSDPPVSLLTSCIQRIRGTTRSDMANVGAHLAASLLGVKERETMFPTAVSALEKTNVTAGDCWFISAFIASHATPRSTVLTVINHLINISEEGYNKPNNVLESALGSMANILRTILSHDKARASLLAGMLDKIQTGFAMGLAENDDFTQDVASSGIGLVYEMASGDQRKALVNDLISRISDGKPFSTTKVYRYDPDLKVRQSMRSIWTVLTASRRGLVEEYADDIAKELQQQLISPEWRVRESACLALADLIQGNDSRYIRSITPQLMLALFRLRDDIKESVRQAANRALTTLGKLAVRLSSESPKGHDPRIFLSSLLPLSKTAGSQLRPHLAELIPSLIDTISDAEPAVLNYVAARSSLDELEMLDDARAKMARTSPMMTAIQDLLPQIDSGVLVAIQPRLCEQLRSSAGASTRTACAQLLTMLALRSPQLLGDHPAHVLFNALISGTRDRNPSVRKHFASAASYMAKYASSSSFETLMRTVLKDLLADDESMKQSAKHVLKNLSANCSELLQGYSKLVVPYVFMETCQLVVRGDEASKKRQEEWSDLWNEIVPSTEAAVRMYREEIISFVVDVLQNNDVWSVRAQAARMLTETTKHLQDRLEGTDAGMLSC
ncbi:HEAT repeat protein, partial [Ostertagia ostertagi]